jgi:hypothetical protein
MSYFLRPIFTIYMPFDRFMPKSEIPLRFQKWSVRNVTKKKNFSENSVLARIKEKLGIDTIPNELTLSYQLKGEEVVSLLDFMASSGARNQSQAARQAMNAGFDLYAEVFDLLKTQKKKTARKLAASITEDMTGGERHSST